MSTYVQSAPNQLLISYLRVYACDRMQQAYMFNWLVVMYLSAEGWICAIFLCWQKRKIIIFDFASGVLEAIFVWLSILTVYDTEI